jgi:hypothetical protein
MTWARPLRALKCTAGTVALEYAIILPVLLLLVMGGMDASRAVWSYVTLQRSVQAAARCGAINSTICGSSSQIITRAIAEAWGLSVSPRAFTVTSSSCGVRVAVNYNLTLLIPWAGGSRPGGQSNTIAINVSSCYPI